MQKKANCVQHILDMAAMLILKTGSDVIILDSDKLNDPPPPPFFFTQSIAFKEYNYQICLKYLGSYSQLTEKYMNI